MPRKKKKDWPEITPVKKVGLPEKLPIYVNGAIDITCLFCKSKPQLKSKLRLYFCTNEEVIKTLKRGLVISCSGCKYRR